MNNNELSSLRTKPSEKKIKANAAGFAQFATAEWILSDRASCMVWPLH
jgi:hypothetical protein